jgi:predicted CoA-binding protein
MAHEHNLVEDEQRIGEIVRAAKRIAILGIKPEDHADRPAFYVAKYLQDHGAEIVPVPVYYPDVKTILGQRVYRKLAEVPGPVDVVDVFRRPADIPPHVDDIKALAPRVVWFQLGIRNDAAARALASAGILVVQDRCLKVEWAHYRPSRS